MAKHAMNMINNDKLKLVDIQKKSPRSQLAQPFMYCITSTLIRFFFYQIISTYNKHYL